MRENEQRAAFTRIALASVRNMIGFGLATALVGYLALNTDIGPPVKLLAAIVVLVMIVSINSLLMFVVYTVEGMPSTMKNKSASVSFWDIYGYILAALAFRLIEASLCIYYIVYMYNVFFG